MSIYEPARALWWLDHKLTATVVPAGADSVWPKAAPTTVGVDKIVVIYQLQAGTDVTNASALRLWNNSLYLVKVVGPATSYDVMTAVADAIDNTLQLAGEEVAGPNGDCQIMRCDRENPVPLPSQVVNGILQENIAALWRIHTRSLVG